MQILKEVNCGFLDPNPWERWSNIVKSTGRNGPLNSFIYWAVLVSIAVHTQLFTHVCWITWTNVTIPLGSQCQSLLSSTRFSKTVCVSAKSLHHNNSVRASDYFSFISSTNSCRADDSPSSGKRVRHDWLINWGSRNKCIKIFYLVMCRLAARRSLSDCGSHLFGHRNQRDYLRHAHRIVRTVGRKRRQLHALASETLGMLGATQML